MALTPSEGWTHYVALQVHNPSVDYQMHITLKRGSGVNDPAYSIMYDNNHCHHDDMRDHRFGSESDPSSASCVQLPEWTEGVDPGIERRMWVKTNGSSVLYLFAGNEDADEYTTGVDTFIHYCEFTGSGDPAGWSDPWGGWIIENDTYKTVSSSMKHAYVTGSSIRDAYVDVRFKITTTVAPYVAVCARKQPGSRKCYWFSVRRYATKPTSEGSRNYYYNGNSNTGLTGVQFTLDGEWHDYTVCFHDNAFSVWWDGEQKVTEASLGGYITTAGEVGLTQWDPGTRYADLFRMRKYDPLMPSWSTFEEWQAVGPAPYTPLSNIDVMPAVITSTHIASLAGLPVDQKIRIYVKAVTGQEEEKILDELA